MKIETFEQLMAEAERIDRERRVQFVMDAVLSYAACNEADRAELEPVIRRRIAAVMRESEASMGRQRDEADRRAGAAERNVERLDDSVSKHSSWLSKAKREAGYPDNISFDVVWSDALRA